MVDLLKVSDKVKTNTKKYNSETNLETIKELESDDSNDSNNILLNRNNIFIKNNKIESSDKYINIENMKIINESEDNKKVNKKELKKELDIFINNNKNKVDNIIYVGGGKKNKIEIRQIDDKYKMKFDNGFSTLTEQNINFNDDKLIKKIRHRKYMRHNREKNKLADLQEEINF